MRRYARTGFALLALASVLLCDRAVASQPQADGIVSLEEPADGILQPIADGPIARVRLRVDRARVEAAGIVEGLGGVFTIDGQSLLRAGDTYDPYAPAFTFSPCDLPQVSDLPDTQLTVAYSVSGVARMEEDQPGQPVQDVPVVPVETGSFVITLGKDTKPPQLTIVSPASGMRVEAGDEVRIVLRAEEPDNLGVWQTGVNRFELLKPDGDRDEQVVSRGGPQPCGAKVTKGEATFTYRVPRNAQPGRTLDFVAEVFDWASPSNRISRSLTLVVEEDEWQGTWTAEITNQGAGITIRRTLTATFTFRHAADGKITGRGVAMQTVSGTGTTTAPTDPGCTWLSHTVTPDTIEFDVSGFLEGQQFVLEMQPLGPEELEVSTCRTRVGTLSTSMRSSRPLSAFPPITGCMPTRAGFPVPATDGGRGSWRFPCGPSEIQYQVEIRLKRP